MRTASRTLTAGDRAEEEGAEEVAEIVAALEGEDAAAMGKGATSG